MNLATSPDKFAYRNVALSAGAGSIGHGLPRLPRFSRALANASDAARGGLRECPWRKVSRCRTTCQELASTHTVKTGHFVGLRGRNKLFTLQSLYGIYIQYGKAL